MVELAGLGGRLRKLGRGVGTDSEFTDDASGWRRQRAGASASDDATNRTSRDVGYDAEIRRAADSPPLCRIRR